MKNERQFGEINHSSRAKESFNFNKEENNPRLNEHFVYRHEENRIGGGSNNTGHEYNDVSHIHRTNGSGIKQNDIARATSSSTSAVSTVATVATTAVVVVVGGSLVVFGQSIEKPSICQFDELYAVDNTIRYSLALGNDIERINSGEETDECDIVIELTCESYNDFKEVKEIKNYGRIDSEFTDLDYSTEYTLNVYQNAFLDLEKEAIIEPIKITTEGNVIPPEPTGSFKVEFESDPFGIEKWFISATYTGDTSNYRGYYVKYGEPMSDGSGEVNWRDPLYLGDSFTERQEIQFIDLDYSSTYTLALITYVENPNGTHRSLFEDGDESREVVLFQQDIDFATIENSFEYTTGIFVHRNILGDGNEYKIYADYLGDTTYYSNYRISVYNEDLSNWLNTVYLSDLREANTLELGVFDETAKYKFTLYCTNTDPAAIEEWNIDHPGSGVETAIDDYPLIEYYEIDFSTIDEYIEKDPVMNGVEFFYKISPNGTEVVLIDLDYVDTNKYWSNFEINLTSVSGDEYSVSSEILGYDFPGYKDEQLYLANLEQPDYEALKSGDFNYTISCLSDEPYDLHPQDPKEVYSQYEDFSALNKTYIPGSVKFEGPSTVSPGGSLNGGLFAIDGLTATIMGLDTTNHTYENSKIVFSSMTGATIEESIDDVTQPHVCTSFTDDNEVWTVTFETVLDGYETVLFSENVDFSEIDGGGQQSTLPNIVNVGLYPKGTYFYDPRLFIEIGFDGQQYNPTDFTIEIYAQDDSVDPITSSIDIFEDADGHALGYYLGDVEDLDSYRGKILNYKIYYDSELVRNDEFEIGEQEEHYFEGCPNIYKGDSMAAVTYYLQLYFEDADIYDGYAFEVAFEQINGDGTSGNTITVTISDYTQAQQLTEINDYSLTYKVSVYQIDKSDPDNPEFFYSEIIDFSMV